MEVTVPATEFVPENIFACGQTFRFREEGGVWRGVAMGNLVEAAPAGEEVRLTMRGRPVSRETWSHYFDLDCSYADLFPAADPVLAKAVLSAPGLRVLNQEPFETLISFIISANNNIPRIMRIVEAICEAAGDPFEVDGAVLHAFPEPEQLAGLSEAKLRKLGAGYRAPYLLESAHLAAQEDFASYADLSTKETVQRLQKYPGVGPKVAGCIALFALAKRDAFPADIWIRRIMRDLYGFEGPSDALNVFAGQQFGEYAGIAQQYLFHYARRNLEPGS